MTPEEITERFRSEYTYKMEEVRRQVKYHQDKMNYFLKILEDLSDKAVEFGMEVEKQLDKECPDWRDVILNHFREIIK